MLPLSHAYVTCSPIIAMEAQMVSLLSNSCCYDSSYCILCHVPHAIPHLTTLHTSHTSQHSTHPTPNAALQPPPLHPSLSLFRVHRDWESARIPVHHETDAQLLCIWWQEYPSVLPVTTWDGGCPSISPSCLVWNSVEQFYSLSAM